jgi:hypothetical protein
MRVLVPAGLFLSLSFLVCTTKAAEADDDGLVGYGEIASGPVFANFLPLESGEDAEHLVTGGHQTSFGAGFSFGVGAFRVNVGARVLHIRLAVEGRYDEEVREDEFLASYDYLGPVVAANVTPRWSPHVNPYLGLTLGTAMLVSDRKGRRARFEHIPVFGTFEAGMAFTLTEWLELRGGVSWVPPVENLNVLAPQLGLRAEF